MRYMNGQRCSRFPSERVSEWGDRWSCNEKNWFYFESSMHHEWNRFDTLCENCQNPNWEIFLKWKCTSKIDLKQQRRKSTSMVTSKMKTKNEMFVWNITCKRRKWKSCMLESQATSVALTPVPANRINQCRHRLYDACTQEHCAVLSLLFTMLSLSVSLTLSVCAAHAPREFNRRVLNKSNW